MPDRTAVSHAMIAIVAVLCAGLPLAQAAGFRQGTLARRVNTGSGHVRLDGLHTLDGDVGRAARSGQDASGVASKKVNQTSSAVDSILGDGPGESEDSEGTGVSGTVSQRAAKMSLDAALRSITPPKDVAELLRAGGTRQKPDIEKAIASVNDMIVKAQARADVKAMDCKSFKAINRNALEAANSELARLGQVSADLAGTKSQSLGTLENIQSGAQKVKETLEKEELAYKQLRNQTELKLSTYKKNLEVTAGMLDVIKCAPGQALLQRSSVVGIRKCQRADGVEQAEFQDPQLASMAGHLSNEGQRLLEEALVQVGAGVDKESKPTSGTDESKPDCSIEKPNCAICYDKLASTWGEMKDLVDDTAAKVQGGDAQWEERKGELNDQLQQFTSQRGLAQSRLADATASAATETENQARKEAEAEELEKSYQATWGECKRTIQDIIYTELCSLVRVRAELLAKLSTGPKPEQITDCQVGKWVPGTCSKKCDDSLVGGVQWFDRSIIVKSSHMGAACPPLALARPCNQVRCPIDCKVGNWTEWTKCTKDCGGGLRTRSRPILQKAKSGGKPCPSTQDAGPCNTGSCDVDCKLGKWGKYSHCSKLCGKGFKERRKDVITPAVGKGECPKSESKHRYMRKACNKQKCAGDERCIAKMDLVLAIDGSGSLTQEGFDIVKTFVAKLVKRMSPKAMQVAAVQFGNGKLQKDKTVTDAKVISPLTTDIDKVSRSIQAQSWQKGMTNLAQAFLKAKDVLRASTRKGIDSVVVVVTDGHPSFKSQTRAALDQLKGFARVVIVNVAGGGADQELLKSYASFPSDMNFIRIPGKEDLAGTYDDVVTDVLVEVCPDAESPSGGAKPTLLPGSIVFTGVEGSGFQLSRSGESCADLAAASHAAETLDDCFSFAKYTPAWASFSYGAGKCLVHDEPCRKWSSDAAYDTYARQSNSPRI